MENFILDINDRQVWKSIFFSLFQVEDPLNQAIRFLRPLQHLASQRIETHLLAFEIYIRKDRLLLMFQSIKRAWLIDPTHHKLHSNLVRFYHIGSFKLLDMTFFLNLCLSYFKIIYMVKPCCSLFP